MQTGEFARRGLLWTACAVVSFHCEAAVTLPAIISDHMVLQKTERTPIWGKAAAGEHVKITLGTNHAEIDADAGGRWQVTLDLSKSAEGPFELLVEGTNRLTITDVAVGEVWLCSGQSNMSFRLGQSQHGEEEIPQSANAKLRHYRVDIREGLVPREDGTGKWEVASPSASGGFTAVGYYFGKRLQAALKQPIGLVHGSVPGTPAEEWMPPESIQRDAALKAAAEKLCQKIAAYPQGWADYVKTAHAWEAQYHRLDRPTPDLAAYTAESASMEGWTPVSLPGKLSNHGFTGSGVYWLRKTITAPEVGNQLWIDLITPGGFETVYWNDSKIVSVTPETSQPSGGAHRYAISPKLVRPGENRIAVRLFCPDGRAGIEGDAARFVVYPFVSGTASLQGEWQAKAEVEFPKLDPEIAKTYPAVPQRAPAAAGRLYNGMIAPVIPFAIRGAIWYQGEANAARAVQYRTTFPELIEGWRQKWGSDFPFYFCQLANFREKENGPTESPWAELREAQSKTLALPKTGQAVLIDLGEEGDIHPRNKRDVGERLARIALAKTYGQPITFSGPVYDSMTIHDGKITLRFQHAEEGLVAGELPAEYQPKSSNPATKRLVRNSPDSLLEGFALCGEDKKWGWANAKIEGQSVIVWSTNVPRPVAVRYGWANNPTCNLYNRAGLPASPFRTDDFAEKTLSAHY
ncbi:MAG: sialate O-acetylesterase [Chthoniobacteraceae bacterium]